MRTNLRTKLGDIELSSPVVLASGTWGYGPETAEIMPLERIGAIIPKGITREPRPGNPGTRVLDLNDGMMNSVGLQNVGLDAFIAETLPALDTLVAHRPADARPVVFVNITGSTVDDYALMTARLSDVAGQLPAAIAAIELNVSCPNVRKGGASFGSTADSVHEVVAAASAAQATPALPLIVKLSPNVTDIVPIAAAALEAGAAALTIANTWVGMAIDVEARRTVFANGVAGVSGPCIKPLTLRHVWQIHRALPDAPLIGLGGIQSGRDAVEYLLAGACAVGVGTASMADPSAGDRIAREMDDWCVAHSVVDINDLIGELDT